MHMFYEKLSAAGRLFQPIFLLGLRLLFGWQLFKSGLGKFNDIPSTAHFFETLHFPLATLQAYMVAACETVGGLLLLVGLASRFAGVMVAIIMLVALATANHDAFVNMFTDPLGLAVKLPFSFLLTALIVFAFGPGTFSLDAFFNRQK